MPKPTEELFLERRNRYLKAMNNEMPDRVPIRPLVQEFAAKYCGKSNQEVACDYQLAFDVTFQCARDFGWDATMPNAIVNWFGMSKAIGWKGIAFPGVDVSLEGATQWTEPGDEESAFLKVDEYDELIDDPTAFLSDVWLPRFTAHIRGRGEPVTFEHNLALISGAMSFVSYLGSFGPYGRRLAEEAGIVPANSGTLKAPLDILGDKMRGYVNLSYDLIERPEKVLAACEALMPHLLFSAMLGADPAHQVPVTIWMHRGNVPFVSPDIFRNIYWATLKPIVEEIWNRGHQVLFYAEGNWDAHLESFAELPERSIIFHVDRTDIFKAHRILGDKFCISGGIPNDLLCIGTPQQVRDHCKSVIDGVAGDGGYILDAGALVMDDAKVENIKAMTDFAREYGVYSQSSSSVIERIDNDSARHQRYPFREGPRKPGICIPWEDRHKEWRALDGDIELVRKTWEQVDSMAYGFLWTNLTW